MSPTHLPDSSHAEPVPLTCPACGHAFHFQLWLIVDGAARPDLLEQAREGALHTVTCPACGQEIGQADAPLLIFTPPTAGEGEASPRPTARGIPPLLFSPAQSTTAEQDREQAAGLLARLRERLGDAWQDEWVADGLSAVPRPLLPLALDDDPEAALRRLAEQMQREIERLLEENPDARRRLEEAIRQMMAEDLSEQEEDEEEDLADRLVAWIQTPDWQASEEYLQQHAAELLTDEAEAELERLRQINPGVDVIPQHQALLRRAREVGIKQAFAEKVWAQGLVSLLRAFINADTWAESQRRWWSSTPNC
ncbi:MAG: hypothetical protein KatS3mg050_3575 [Litorilinea sp.]|nr:MAG: hypothetical protein KatS3mg050_3575 [Litorilinea sp.]